MKSQGRKPCIDEPARRAGTDTHVESVRVDTARGGGRGHDPESGPDARTAVCTAEPLRARCAAQGARLRAPQPPGGWGGLGGKRMHS